MPGSRPQIGKLEVLLFSGEDSCKFDVEVLDTNVRESRRFERKNTRFAFGCLDDSHRPKGALCVVATEIKV